MGYDPCPDTCEGMVIAEKTLAHFESIESAHEYVGLLCEALDDAQRAIEQEIAHPGAATGRRHLDALRIVDYKLKTLREHFVASRRLLTDLRTLRRHLLNERTTDPAPPETASTVSDEPPRRVSS